jgi:uncharacterized DUF497 family protein
VDYEWDPNKAAKNVHRHNVSFEEAASVFNDPLYVDFHDPNHSLDERRYIIIGVSTSGRLLLVSYTERETTIRLIGARDVTPAERKAYEEG